MHKFPLRLVAILLLSTNVFAEPSDTIKTLMKLRVSMFDLGLVRLESELGKGVSYQPDSNRIGILAKLGMVAYASSTELEQACKEVMEGIKLDLGVNPEDGNPLIGKSSLARIYFTPPSADKTSMSDAAAQQIDSIIEINCVGRLRVEEENIAPYKCNSKLRSIELLCGRQ